MAANAHEMSWFADNKHPFHASDVPGGDMDVQVENQFRNLSLPAVSYAVDGITDRRMLLQSLLLMLSRLIPCDAIAWHYLDLVTGAVVIEGFPPDIYDSQTALWPLILQVGDHPMINSYRQNPVDLSPRRMSDVISTADLRKTRAYAEVLRPTHSERQMTVVPGADLPSGGRSFTLARETGDFTDEELRLLADIQPILVALDAQISRIDPSLPPAEAVRIRDQEPEPQNAGGGPGLLSLTKRETEVLSLIARGLTAGACAHLLRISERTARKHLENAYAKLGCHDRMGAVNRAKRLGFID